MIGSPEELIKTPTVTDFIDYWNRVGHYGVVDQRDFENIMELLSDLDAATSSPPPGLTAPG
jgi:hypothetical protein